MHNKNPLASLTGKLDQFHISLTRTKLLLFAFTLIAVGFALGGLESGPDKGLDDEAVANKIVNLSLPDRHKFQAIPGEVAETGMDIGNIASPLETELWDGVTVRPGQSLDAIFRQQGFSIQTLFEIMALSKETKQLKKIRPGDLFEFQQQKRVAGIQVAVTIL